MGWCLSDMRRKRSISFIISLGGQLSWSRGIVVGEKINLRIRLAARSLRVTYYNGKTQGRVVGVVGVAEENKYGLIWKERILDPLI